MAHNLQPLGARLREIEVEGVTQADRAAWAAPFAEAKLLKMGNAYQRAFPLKTETCSESNLGVYLHFGQ